jgi:hypothetical protein
MSHSAKNKTSQSHSADTDAPNDPEEHHRLEAKSYVFLSFWITADILVVYGHNSLALWAFYFALSLPIYLLAHHAGEGWPKWKTVGKWFLVVILLILPAWLFVISRLDSFSIESIVNIYEGPFLRDRGVPSTWCVHPRVTDGKYEASPVYICMYARIVNRTDKPMFVDGFQIETRNKKGIWEKMPVFDVDPPIGDSVFYNVTRTSQSLNIMLHDVRQLDFHGDFLQSRLSEKPLSPYEPMQGWLMVGISKDGDVDVSHMRFSLATGGKIFTKPLNGTPISTNCLDVQTVKSRAKVYPTDTKDISGFPRRFYGDEADYPH